MAEANLEVLKRVYDGWAAGRFEAEASIYDPHLVYVSQASEPNPGPHYGLAAFTSYFQGFLEIWDDFRIEALAYREAGDSIVVRVRRTAVGKGSGLPVDDEAFHVWTFRGPSVIRLEVFEGEGEALDAVGLRKSEEVA